jgi:hypothetical protein
MERKIWVVVTILVLISSCAVTVGSDLEEMKKKHVATLETV